MPSQPCATLPDSTSWAAICRTRSMGMAKPNAASLPPRSVVMPMTAPLASTSGPPDHDGLDGIVGLDQAVERLALGVEAPFDRADVAGGDRRFAVRFGRPAERDRWSTHGEVGGGPEDRNREVAGVDRDDGDVGGEVRAEDLALEPTSISELHGHRGRARHLVGAGEHQAVVPDHDPRGGRRAVLVGHDQVDDGRTELLGQGREARLVLEDRVGDHGRHRHLLHDGLLGGRGEGAGDREGAAAEGRSHQARDHRDRPDGLARRRARRRRGRRQRTAWPPAGQLGGMAPEPIVGGERWTDASPLVVGIVVRGHGSRR